MTVPHNRTAGKDSPPQRSRWIPIMGPNPDDDVIYSLDCPACGHLILTKVHLPESQDTEARTHAVLDQLLIAQDALTSAKALVKKGAR